MTTITKQYVNGQLVEAEAPEKHVMSLGMHVKIWAALMVLTVLTVLVSLADFGTYALAAALTIAFIKSALVVTYFMHLKYDKFFHTFIFFTALFFVALFFTITFYDQNTRGMQNPEWDNDYLARDKGKLDRPEPRAMTEDELIKFKATH